MTQSLMDRLGAITVGPGRGLRARNRYRSLHEREHLEYSSAVMLVRDRGCFADQ